MVMQPPAVKARVSTVTSVEEAPTVDIPAERRARFQNALARELYAAEGGFVQGPELTIKWRFVQFNGGSQAARYFLGFGAGKGSLAVQAKFYDGSGNELASIQSEGEISAGVFGGSMDEAIDKCASEIATYAKTQFR